MTVGEQRHVVVAIPHDIAEAPGARQSAQVRRRLEDRDAVTMLGEAVGQREAEHPAPDDAPMAAARSSQTLTRYVEDADADGGASSMTCPCWTA